MTTLALARTTSVTHRVDNLPRLESAWRRLQADDPSASIFSTWQWNAAAARHFARPDGLDILLLGEADEPLALAPLAWRRVAGLRTLAFLGSCLRDYSRADYQDVLVRPGAEDAAADALIAELASRRADWDCVWLQELPSASPLLSRLPQRARQHGWNLLVEPASDVYSIALPDTWSAYLAGLSANTREAIGRKTRKLQREHAASFQRIASSADLAPALETLFELHQQRWHGQGCGLLAKPTIFNDARTRAFHRDLASDLLADGLLDLTLLHADGAVVGARYAFEFGGSKSFYASGYRPDGDWPRLSLGLVMDAHSIQDSIERGFTREDLLRNDGDYKHRYNPQRSDNRQILIFASRAAERRFEALRSLRKLAKRLLRRH